MAIGIWLSRHREAASESSPMVEGLPRCFSGNLKSGDADYAEGQAAPNY
jgi:hypothetical protein